MSDDQSVDLGASVESTPIVRCIYRMETLCVPDHWQPEMQRLSLEADPDTQAALNRLLDERAFRMGRMVAKNLTTTAGLNSLGTTYFPNGNWFVFIKGTGAVNAADTMASHAAWSELVAYTQLARPALTLGSWSGGSASNTANRAIFTASGSMTVAGSGLVNASAKGGTGGILHSVANFTGNQALTSGQVIRVEVVATFTSA